MRIIIIHQHDPVFTHVGGVGTFINTFFKYAPEDFEVSLIGVSADPEKRPIGVWQKFQANGRTFDFLPVIAAHPTYHERFPLSLRFASALWRYRRLVNFKDAMIEFHRIELALVFRNVKARKVLFYHTHPHDLYNPKTENHWKYFPWLYFWLERWLIADIDECYSVREDIVDSYRERYPKLRQHFSFLPTWVDDEVFQSLPEEERAEQKQALARLHGFDPKSRLLLFVGRFELQKDPFLLLESFRYFERRDRNAQLVMIGSGSLETPLRSLIESNGLRGKVHLIGSQPQPVIARWMNASDCLCLTSAYEGMSRVVLEALQCGLPVVSTEAGEERRVIQNPAAGRLVKDRNPEAISNAFAAVLDQPADRAACQKQVAPFGAKAVLAKLFASYRKLDGVDQ